MLGFTAFLEIYAGLSDLRSGVSFPELIRGFHTEDFDENAQTCRWILAG